MDINIKFLGNSKISINKETITISQNKPKAVLFYILYKKYCTRDEIITIFWPNLSINKGRLNLRSVLHKLRDKLKYEIIISSGNDILKINEKCSKNLIKLGLFKDLRKINAFYKGKRIRSTFTYFNISKIIAS